jgi:hypothetical protein
MTKKQIDALIRAQVAADDRVALRALLIINTRQTSVEQSRGTVVEKNHVGFRISDARKFNQIIRHYQRFGHITSNMGALLRQRMPRYSKQLFEEAVRKGKYVQIAPQNWKRCIPVVKA